MTINNTRLVRSVIDRLEIRYNPEDDRSPGVAVSWADMQEAGVLLFLINAVDHLQDQIDKLERERMSR